MNPPKIYSCREWGAMPVVVRFSLKKADGAVVHHTTSPNRNPSAGDREVAAAFRLARSIQNDHMGRNDWADTGNHFTISRGGILLEGRHGSLAGAVRGMVPYGAHAGDTDANDSMWGAEWEGKYDQKYLVTPEQWRAAVELYAWLAYWGSYDTANTFPHKRFKATACPGLIADHLDDFRREVHDKKVAIIRAKGAK